METTSSRYNWLNAVALLLILPATYFICISVLKFGLGIAGPFDSSAPFLERMGIKESLGWNINLLILLGPIAALLVSVFQVLRIEWEFTKERLLFRVTVQKKWFPITIALFSGLVLGTLFVYLLGENCNCI